MVKDIILGSPIVQDPNKTLILKVETDIPEMKITLKNIWLHFKKICTHKYWVAHYCFRVNLYWQGLMHDISKFSWTEFWESVKYYQGTSSPINACKEHVGYSLSWQHHKGRNPHHYEYWTDRYDDGTVAIEMPYKYAAEMICDYIGAARAYLGKKFNFIDEYKWWVNKRDDRHAKIHPNTAKFVTNVFSFLAEYEEQGYSADHLLNENLLKVCYKLSHDSSIDYSYKGEKYDF